MIELQHLQKVIDQTLVVDIDRLEIHAGEIVALVGPVGSGRDPLLTLLTGKARPTVGAVRLAGIDPATDHEAFSRQVGILFAEDGLYMNRTVQSNLWFHGQLRGLPRRRVEATLAEVGLADHAHTRVDKLPTGLMRRLAFGRTLLHDPHILLLEEPFARCDEASITLLSRLILHRAEAGATILILADNVANLRSLCTMIYILNQGHIVVAYTPEDTTQPQLPFKVPARLEDKVVLVNPADILYAVADQGKVTLQTTDGMLPVQFTLTELEQRLVRSGFFRAHRGYLVNLQHVKEVIPYTRSSFSLRLDDEAGTKIPLSKSAAAELRELLGY
ncbi:MAG: LytTR family transcriptional regulator DNA-binding domain-containing protein [Anaerolineae bacterium]|nr:LytTR family transcriptional regulator DNA-binding domain-containing protein [Anaerolineae bacterium]